MAFDGNPARFLVNGLPSEDVDGNRGVIVANGALLTLQLEAIPSGALSALFEIVDPTIPTAPLASFEAPLLTFLTPTPGLSSALLTDPDNQTATINMVAFGANPNTDIHAYVMRCTVTMASGPQVFERSITTVGVNTALRKTFPAEQTEFSVRGWSDHINQIVDAIESGGGGGGSQDLQDVYTLDGTVSLDVSGGNDMHWDSAVPDTTGLGLFGFLTGLSPTAFAIFKAPNAVAGAAGVEGGTLGLGAGDGSTPTDPNEDGGDAGTILMGSVLGSGVGGAGSPADATFPGGAGGAGSPYLVLAGPGGIGGVASAAQAGGPGGPSGPVTLNGNNGGVGGAASATAAAGPGGPSGQVQIGGGFGGIGGAGSAGQAAGAGGPATDLVLDIGNGGAAGADGGGGGADGGAGANWLVNLAEGGTASGGGTDGAAGNMDIFPGDGSTVPALRLRVGLGLKFYGPGDTFFNHIVQSVNPVGNTIIGLPTDQPATGDVLTVTSGGTNTQLEWAPPGGGGGDLVSWDVSQTAHGLAVRDVVRLDSSGDYVKAQADDGSTLGVFIVVAVAGVNDFTIGIVGRYTDAAHGLTVGDYYYLSSDTSGLLTDTEPTSPNFSNPIVLAKDANTLVIVPWRPSSLSGSGGGGGGSLATTVWSPDAPPETPNVLDDEFNGVTITGWAELDNSSELTGTENSGHMHLAKATNAGVDMAGFFRTVPAVSDYTIWTKCMIQREAGGVYLAGLFLAEDLDANPTTANVFQMGMSLTDAAVATIARTAYNSGGTPLNLVALSLRLMVYVRARVSGTTVDVDISWDGMSWRNMVAGVAHGLSTIARYGVFIDNRTGITETASFDFVRVTESSSFNQILGGFITGAS